MLHILKRHPIPITAYFDHCLALTYAFESSVLSPLLPPGLTLDQHEDMGFVAVALVQTRGLRPTFVPDGLGREFFLAGYRIFAKHRSQDGITRRGLRILRSDTDRRAMAFFGNLLTHYNYQVAASRFLESEHSLRIEVDSHDGQGDLRITAHLGVDPERPPEGSPFRDHADARRFAGPLPWTFDYEKETHSIVRIKGVRSEWTPRPIRVDVDRLSFFDSEPFRNSDPVLASAFHLRGVPYRWERGIREPLHREANR